MPSKVPFGLLAGKLVEPGNVANGKSCGCICPGCGRPLVAYNGPQLQKTSYFGHMPGEECQHAVESALHLAGKEVLVRERRMRRPDLGVDMDGICAAPTRPLDSRLLEVTTLARYEEVLSEQWMFSGRGLKHTSAFRADVQARDVDGTDWIEIRVTHAVDGDKQSALQAEGLRVIEIDLRRFMTGTVSLSDIEHAVIDDVSNKKWLAHPGVPAAMAAMRAEAERGRPQTSASLPSPQLELLPPDWRINQPVRREYPYLARPRTSENAFSRREADLRWRLGLDEADRWPEHLNLVFDDDGTCCVLGRHWMAEVYLVFLHGCRLSRLDVSECIQHVRDVFRVTSLSALARIEHSLRGRVLRHWERCGYVLMNIDGSVWITGKR